MADGRGKARHGNEGCRDCGHRRHKPGPCGSCQCGHGGAFDQEYRTRATPWRDPVLRTLIDYHGCDPDQIRSRQDD
jgi:hypothetical protein